MKKFSDTSSAFIPNSCFMHGDQCVMCHGMFIFIVLSLVILEMVKQSLNLFSSCVCVCVCVCVWLSHVWLFATPWTIAIRLLCPWGFSRQEYWNGLPCSSPGDLFDVRYHSLLDMNLSNLWEIMEDRGVWHAVVHGLCSWVWLSDWITVTVCVEF